MQSLLGAPSSCMELAGSCRQSPDQQLIFGRCFAEGTPIAELTGLYST